MSDEIPNIEKIETPKQPEEPKIKPKKNYTMTPARKAAFDKMVEARKANGWKTKEQKMTKRDKEILEFIEKRGIEKIKVAQPLPEPLPEIVEQEKPLKLKPRPLPVVYLPEPVSYMPPPTTPPPPAPKKPRKPREVKPIAVQIPVPVPQVQLPPPKKVWNFV